MLERTMPFLLVALFVLFWLWDSHPGVVIGLGSLIAGGVAYMIYALGQDDKAVELKRQENLRLINEKLGMIDGTGSLRLDIGYVFGNAMALSSDGLKIAYLEKPESAVRYVLGREIMSVEVVESSYRQDAGHATGQANGVSLSAGGIGVSSGSTHAVLRSTGVDMCHHLSVVMQIADPAAPLIEFSLIKGTPGSVGWSKGDPFYTERNRTSREWESIIHRMIKMDSKSA